MAAQKSAREMTIDQLAAAVGMTVRNVRAYASRGLLAPPRLVGRTGYYDQSHADRLKLVRELVERGYTLNAVEKALAESPVVSDSNALDLLSLLAKPLEAAHQPEDMSIDELASLSGIGSLREDLLLDELVAMKLIERIDDDHVRVLYPTLVRIGAQAIGLGLERAKVIGMLATINEHLDAIARPFVDAFRDDVWTPFREAGMPEEKWQPILASMDALLPIASQAVLAAFRDRLALAIDDALGEELAMLTGEQIEELFGDAAGE